MSSQFSQPSSPLKQKLYHVRTDRLHKAGAGLITLIRDITFTTTNIPSTINTHTIEFQMVKVYTTLHAAHQTYHTQSSPEMYTLWHSYIDDHRGQLIADVISNSNHIPLNTDKPTRVPNTSLQQTYLPYITTMSYTLFNRTSWTTQHALSSDQLSTTITIRHE